METKTSINFLLEDNITEAFRILLHYYDKMYKKGLHNREGWEALCTEINYHKVDPTAVANKIILTQTTSNVRNN